MAPKTLIQNAALAKTNPGEMTKEVQKNGAKSVLSAILDGDGYKKRLKEIMGGPKAEKFASGLITMANNDAMLAQVAAEAPHTIITSAMKAALLGLEIEPSLGQAYIVPFKNSRKDANGNWVSRMEATFVIGWHGLYQLAMRTGLYKNIHVGEIYEGQTVCDNQLTGEITLEGEKTSSDPVGYIAFFKLLNGFEKCVYMTKEEVIAHEQKNRKGQNMGKAWRDNFDAMAEKTVLRRLLSKWGPLSIDYQSATPEMAKAAETLKNAANEDEAVDFIPADGSVDLETGEILHETTEKEGA